MFSVNGNVIQLSRGDTGAVKFTADATIYGTGQKYHFGERDRALFTIRNMSTGQTVKEKVHTITNDEFVVYFKNADTDQITPGTYTWDVRYVLNAHFDETGRLADGDQVITPEQPMNFQILTVVGDI